MGTMSLYDLIQGESVVQNCTASYWSVFVYHDESHQSRSHDLIKLPLQFSTELSSSGGINYLKTRLFFGISV